MHVTMFPNKVSRKGEIFNYVICGPKCPIPFHSCLLWPNCEEKEGSAPREGGVIMKERERIGLLVISLPELLFVNVTDSLSDNQMQDFLAWCLCALFFLTRCCCCYSPFDKFDFQTSEKIKDQRAVFLFFDKTSVTTSFLPWIVA